MTNRIYLNNNWKFSETYDKKMLKKDYDDSFMQEVRLPHTCKETPFHYFDESIYQMVSVYRRKLEVPVEWMGKRVLLTLEGVAHDSEVYVNGQMVDGHHCGYTAFQMDISQFLHYGKENVLAVKVDSRESLNIPPFGNVIDYMTYGGIYREVYLEVKNVNYLEDVFHYSELRQDGKSAILISRVNVYQPDAPLHLKVFMRKRGEGEFVFLTESNIEENQKENELRCVVAAPELWGLDNPVLYEIKTQLKRNTEILDENITVFGFRRAEFRKDGFYLNFKKVKIRGLNRHQSYPYVGYAMPKSMQIMDAEILKKELGLNAVRTSHYPQSHHFIRRCDELGLLVFTEIPGWQYIGDEAWRKQALKNTRDMIREYRNHPSIILWGVRINESRDHDELYQQTNELARKMDPSRPTGGVRALKKGSLLEDVYTYNDFSHDGKKPGCEPKKNITPDLNKPYMITEYCGHMFPTKSFDWEGKRVEHAVRHANVMNAVAGQQDIAGSFGWCMADYNTHKDFGSGDRICYHGVLDMFRNHKLAAAVYSSQQEKNPVLTVGSGMDIGEYPGGNKGENWLFTNADSVRMYKNDQLIKEYVSGDSVYQNLKHGPLLVDDYIGDTLAQNEEFQPKHAAQIKDALNAVAKSGTSQIPLKVLFTALKMMLIYHMKPIRFVDLYTKYIGDWGGSTKVYRFEAVKDGQVVKSVIKEPMKQVRLQAVADHTELLEEETYDVAAIRIQSQDEHGNLLSVCGEPVSLRTEGPVQLIGENVISLKGGMGGTYVKTTGESGTAALYLKMPQAEEVKIEFQINVKEG